MAIVTKGTPLQPQNLEPGMLFFAALGLDVDCCAALPFISLARRVDSTCFTNTLGLDWTGLIKTLTPWTSVRSPWPGSTLPPSFITASSYPYYHDTPLEGVQPSLPFISLAY
ncbi:hypothetical protein BDV98DRAFT_607650 [Pterulicium gracile]|uniref:Uncharacterized protein n=1 Tax=Pterulicium gracile TaxID=1884261 RepID=A0A5C3QAC0_9AGAR|nr:hypothetical protein BDV98DRAFT_607650 [Pterula gracilis]